MKYKRRWKVALNLPHRKGLCDQALVAQALRTTINNWDLMTLKGFCTARTLSLKQSGILQSGGKSINQTSGRGLVSEIYIELKADDREQIS